MKTHFFRVAVLVCLSALLHGCMGPTTPQGVAKAFWAAVLNQETEKVVQYSTLTESKYYDSFSKDWAGYRPSYGKVTIENDKASVVSNLAAPANSGRDDRDFTTYLIRRDGEWKVDYDRTKQSIQGGALGNLLSKFDQLSDGMSKQMEASADSLKREMDRMSTEFDSLSASSSKQASEILDKYAGKLRQSIQEFKDSINRALENNENKLSPQDERSLRAISDQLGKDRNNLDQPTTKAVSDSSKDIGAAQQKLEAIDNASLDDYKAKWRKMSAQLEQQMREMLNELSSASDAKAPN